MAILEKIDYFPERDYQAEAKHLQALAHPVRLEILQLLHDEGELTAGVIQYTLDLPQTALSYHLRLLRQSGAVTVRAADLLRFYRLADPMPAIVRATLRFS